MLLDVIKQRRSVRTFSPERLDKGHRSQLQSYLENITEGPFGHTPRIVDVPVTGDKGEGRRIGTYGVIKGPQGYLVGICRLQREPLMDLGHIMQGAVLLLTSLGVGTCWLGGTFRRSDIEANVDLMDGEEIAAVIPYGYPAGKSRALEGLMKKAAGSSKRMAFDELFTFTGGSSEEMCGCLEAVRLAPSSMNNQPWRAIVENDDVHLFMVLPRMVKAEAGLNMRYLDIGIAMRHLEGVCRESFGQVEWFNDGTASQRSGKNMEYVSTLRISRS